MASEPLIDLEALLAPISGDNPAGDSLRFAGDYDEINQLRPKADRDALEPGGQEGQWPKIVQVASKKLRDKSKDLYLASWLTEALVHLHGFAGFRDGLKLIRGLLDQYWENVYPLAEDLEVRAAPLVTLLEKNAPTWIGEVSLTHKPIKDPETGEPIPVTYNLWDSIVVKQLEDKKPLEPAMASALSGSPTEFCQRLKGDLDECLAELEALQGLLNERLQDAAPGVTAARDALQGCANRIRSVLKDRGLEGGTSEDSGGGEHDESSAAVAGNGSAGKGPVRSRQDALQRLHEVAEFFRRTEPHSPVPYLILRAINWSRLPFDKLLMELVKDQSALEHIHSTLGISENGGLSEATGD